MATCERINPVPVPPPPVYRLELNEEEARLLRRLLFSNVAMSAYPLTGVSRALVDAGVTPSAGRFVGRQDILVYQP